MIVYVIGSLKKREKVKVKSKISSFIYFCILKVYFDFAICLFNLYIIVSIKYI